MADYNMFCIEIILKTNYIEPCEQSNSFHSFIKEPNDSQNPVLMYYVAWCRIKMLFELTLISHYAHQGVMYIRYYAFLYDMTMRHGTFGCLILYKTTTLCCSIFNYTSLCRSQGNGSTAVHVLLGFYCLM